ncbi:RING-H2 finger protein ATL74-like [Phragmites australis]|uniref:RING-H2 finger protein ATL74-like n=1 Tax=Phragmites australis TaxID=29695 RepID=UPI002D77A517|nr:RING-H2 finger protein ATL74-like [Phragmites australis]
MAQVWAVSLAVASLAIGMLGVLGVWICYLFDAVARGCAPPTPPPTPQTASEEAADDDADDFKNGLSEAELRRLGGVVVAESGDGEEQEKEALCPICLDAMEPGRAVRVLPGCNSAFHQDCVDRWLAISPRCPVCNVWAAPPSPAASPPAPKTGWDS